MSANENHLQLIPLNKLVRSPRNVRRKDRKSDIDALAASIAAKGLLQNLCVVPNAEGKYEVDAGGRRLLALKALAKVGAIAKDFEVPCNVLTVEAGREASLAENVHRVAMDAMDEVDAYAALVDEGQSVEQIAHRFGVERRHVEQRLALSALSPKIKAAWKRGEVSLEAAKAFCLVPDHGQQEAVFKSLGKPVTHAGSVRARLMEGRMRSSDRYARFVGAEAYEAAGGAISRDLFETDAVYMDDPALVMRLAEEKLQARIPQLVAEGWGWAEVVLGGTGSLDLAPARIYPDWREPTSEEAADLQRLRADLEKLDADLDADSVDDDPRWEERDTLAGQIETIRQQARVWDVDLVCHAGVSLSVDNDGNISFTYGLVRRDDEKLIRSAKKSRAGEDDVSSDDDQETSRGHEPDGMDDLIQPKAVIKDLSLARTKAIRHLLADDRHVSLALVVSAMLARAVFKTELAGVFVSAHPQRIDDLEVAQERRASLLSCLPDEDADLLGWCIGQPTGTLLALLAMLVADAVDLSHDKGSSADAHRRGVADKLAQTLKLDMAEFWTPDAGYWSRLSKRELIAVMEDSPAMVSASKGKRQSAMKAFAKLRRDELAAKVGEELAGTRYLPALLITPLAAGDLSLTEAGVHAIAAE